MAIDLEAESILSLTAAAKSLPGRPHISTTIRWYKAGVRGVKLETILLGGKRFTSREALQRFADRLTAADAGDVPPRLSHARRQQKQRAKAHLDEAWERPSES
jgi:hypothetical protein